jgi:hypothetical protein
VLAGLSAADPFFAVLAGGLVVAAGCALWVEMLVREIAVYVVVAMLPLVFAGMVWPARRVWAVRAVELLIALILSKFAIVAVLALGGAALGTNFGAGPAAMLVGLTLVTLAACSPWALLRLLPLHEMASAAVGGLRQHGQADLRAYGRPALAVASAADRAAEVPERMRDSEPMARDISDDESAASSGSNRSDGPGGPGGGAGEPPSPEGGPGPASAPPSPNVGPDPASASPGPDVGPGPAGGPAGDPGPPLGPAGQSRGGVAGPDRGARSDGPDDGTDGAGSRPRERPPMPAIFAAPSGSWRPLTLGPEDHEADVPLLDEPAPEASAEPLSSDDRRLP